MPCGAGRGKILTQSHGGHKGRGDSCSARREGGENYPQMKGKIYMMKTRGGGSARQEGEGIASFPTSGEQRRGEEGMVALRGGRGGRELTIPQRAVWGKEHEGKAEGYCPAGREGGEMMMRKMEGKESEYEKGKGRDRELNSLPLWEGKGERVREGGREGADGCEWLCKVCRSLQNFANAQIFPKVGKNTLLLLVRAPQPLRGHLITASIPFRQA